MSKIDVTKVLDGVEKITLEGSDCKVFRMSKTTFRRFKDHQLLDLAGVYLLSSTDEEEDRIYIGEGDDVRTRLKSHSFSKRFWNYVHIFTSDNMNIAFAKNIENSFILKAKRASSHNVTNSEEGGSKKLGSQDLEYLKESKKQFFQIIDAIGLTIFESSPKTLYSCTGKGFEIHLAEPDSINRTVKVKKCSQFSTLQVEKYDLRTVWGIELDNNNILTEDVIVDIGNSSLPNLFGNMYLTKFKNYNGKSIISHL
ncbi:MULTISPECIES: GIY-YIG nuclease family protein [Vibrio]|uniref:GIY-YIG nuclease family protein n=1 Tax=Vibrio TaxID=662 RepID=UPI0004038917|nr:MULTISPECIES: GIY-YIG nuclease family protein [Vibrio]